MKYFILIFFFISNICIAQSDWIFLESPIEENFHDIEFINDTIGFIYSYGSGRILKTSNGGFTWVLVKQTDSIYYEQIQFINKNTGWICGEKGSLLKTTDCGNSWFDLSIKRDERKLLLYGMLFTDELTGYLSGGVMSEQKIEPEFLKTTDGGKSWTKIPDDIPNMILNLKKVSNSIFGSGTGVIIKIDNNEADWKYVFQDTSKIVGQIRDIAFANGLFAMGVSFNGKILITSDGGESWIYKGVTKNRLRSIKYLGRNRWIMAGDNNAGDGSVMYFSDDNGESWEKITDLPDIHRIALSENYVWIAGKSGLIGKRRR